MQTYMERVLRYRLLKHRPLPAEHRAEMIAQGEDPDDWWSLVYSFRTLEAAEKCKADQEADEMPGTIWKIVDTGAETVIERPVY